MRYYTLGPDHELIPCENYIAWIDWFMTADRQVALTHLPFGCVSTIFLGIDSSLWLDGEPAVFETMIFDTEARPVWCDRTASWIEALACHDAALREALKAVQEGGG